MDESVSGHMKQCFDTNKLVLTSHDCVSGSSLACYHRVLLVNSSQNVVRVLNTHFVHV